jgi:hypothetical protein
MIICPWCGTAYETFQSNCRRCGGPLVPPAPEAAAPPEAAGPSPLVPPAPPRPISGGYAWRLLLTDGGFIAAFVVGLLGMIFTVVGGVLTIFIITAFVGIPFLILGLAFLAGGGGLFYWRYGEAQKAVRVLREGEAVLGQITGVEQNLNVRVNGRYPWAISYAFQAGGRDYAGRVSTLNPPGPRLQAGQSAYVLYLPSAPDANGLYPHP